MPEGFLSKRASCAYLLPLAVSASLLFVNISIADAGNSFPGKGKEDVWMQARTVSDIGQIQMQSGQYAEAINSFKNAISIYRDDPLFFCALGAAFEKTNRLAEAEKAYRDALAQDPKTADAWFRLAELCTKLKKTDQADIAYGKAYSIAPNRFDICFKQAINLSQKNNEEAGAVMKRALSLARTDKEKLEVKQYMSKVSAETAPPQAGSVRLFKIFLQEGNPAANTQGAANQVIGTDGLFAYAGPAGRVISQRGLKRVLELVLIDNANRRMRLNSQDALSMMRGKGIAGLKAKGWAGEVRPVPVSDLNPKTETGSQFVIPPAI